ncbi:MAG: hypothetical protein ACRYFS_03675 [Janthinobacterium lividum]
MKNIKYYRTEDFYTHSGASMREKYAAIYGRCCRTEKRLVNLAHGYPPFLATHWSGWTRSLLPDVPPLAVTEILDRMHL